MGGVGFYTCFLGACPTVLEDINVALTNIPIEGNTELGQHVTNKVVEVSGSRKAIKKGRWEGKIEEEGWHLNNIERGKGDESLGAIFESLHDKIEIV